MTYRVGNLVELLILKINRYNTLVSLPDHETVMMKTVCFDLGPKGLPELGEKVWAVVRHVENGMTYLDARKDELIKFGYSDDFFAAEIHGNDAVIFQPSRCETFPSSEEVDQHYCVGQELQVKLTDFDILGAIVEMPNGIENWILHGNYDSDPKGEFPEIILNKSISVVVLANRNDQRPYLGARQDQMEKFGLSLSNFRFRP